MDYFPVLPRNYDRNCKLFFGYRCNHKETESDGLMAQGNKSGYVRLNKAERDAIIESGEYHEKPAIHHSTRNIVFSYMWMACSRCIRKPSERNGSVWLANILHLKHILRDLPARRRQLTLSFEQIEQIVKSPLPASAYEDRRWWDHEKEGNHVSARAWANAGWKVETVNFSEKWVKLVRVG